ncbi:agmatine deiminase [Nitrincola alkalilacustris]|uniref:agmatine deiminase n=1 Tax=Nitrincola alkalilacustris TaxID=1571224 RepID=UPI00197EDB6A|nr:agmatine deiminase [Nitrincola alkalilacustris]
MSIEKQISDLRAAGFRMPGEFEPHEACWMIWPERPDVWRLGGRPAQEAFAAVAEAIARSETVYVGVSDAQYEHARSMLASHIRVVEISSNDSWVRDTGPTYLINDRGLRAGIDWDFNAWGGLNGGLYFPWDRDQRVARKICGISGDPVFRAPLILEGGSIHVDGEGTLLTTEECLLNPNRNPDLSREEIEALLAQYLNISKVIWIGRGTFNDETDGHIDNLACFVRPGEVALHWCDDPDDPQYAIAREAYEVLSQAQDAKGRRLTIHKLPHPGPLYITPEEAGGIHLNRDSHPREAGERLAGSYVNFYIGNQVVVFPLLDPARDEEARACLQRIFPEREVIGVDAREILLGGGNIHCITQQQPAR